MNISEIKIFIVNEERLKAYVTITLDACFVVRDLKIIQGPGGLFVAMPSKKRKDGQYRDIAHPLNQQTRELLEDQIFAAYESELKKLGQSLARPWIGLVACWSGIGSASAGGCRAAATGLTAVYTQDRADVCGARGEARDGDPRLCGRTSDPTDHPRDARANWFCTYSAGKRGRENRPQFPVPSAGRSAG